VQAIVLSACLLLLVDYVSDIKEHNVKFLKMATVFIQYFDICISACTINSVILCVIFG